MMHRKHGLKVSLGNGLRTGLTLVFLLSQNVISEQVLTARRYARLIPPINGNTEPSVIFGDKPSRVNLPYGEQLQKLDSESNFDSPSYDFAYRVHGGGNFFGHQESRAESKTQGKYHVLMSDGRMQIVNYYVDDTGYHPTITYELVPNSNVEGNPTRNDGYRSKRSRHFRHGKRVRTKIARSF